MDRSGSTWSEQLRASQDAGRTQRMGNGGHLGRCVGAHHDPSGRDHRPSAERAERMVGAARALLAGERPALPRIGFNFVHIRDVVDLHLHALTDDATIGQRIVAVSDFLWLHDIAVLLRRTYGERAAKVPLRQAPDWLVKLIGFVSVDARLAAPSLGQKHAFNAERAETLLGRALLPASQAITDATNSLFIKGFA